MERKEGESEAVGATKKELIRTCGKNNVRKWALQIGHGLTCLSTLNSGIADKCQLIYWRLFDIAMKIDSLDGKDTGNQTLGIKELGTD
jgi:hypothetical protein